MKSCQPSFPVTRCELRFKWRHYPYHFLFLVECLEITTQKASFTVEHEFCVNFSGQGCLSPDYVPHLWPAYREISERAGLELHIPGKHWFKSAPEELASDELIQSYSRRHPSGPQIATMFV